MMVYSWSIVWESRFVPGFKESDSPTSVFLLIMWISFVVPEFWIVKLNANDLIESSKTRILIHELPPVSKSVDWACWYAKVTVSARSFPR